MRRCIFFKSFVSAITLLLSGALLAGCSGKEDVSQAEAQTSGQMSGQTSALTEETVDWKTEGLAVSGEVEKNQEWWVTEYIPWKHENVEIEAESEGLWAANDSPPSRVYGDKIYRLNMVWNPPNVSAVRWIMEIYDTSAMSSSVKEISREQLGLTDAQKGNFLTAMDLVKEDSFVFQLDCWEKNTEGLTQIVSNVIYLNSNGDYQLANLWDTYLEKGIAREELLEGSLMPEPGNCVCDNAGNTYKKAGLSDAGYTRLYVIDREGAVLLEYQSEEKQMIFDPLKTENGELIYPVYDRDELCYYFMWPDTETGEMRPLGTMKDSNLSIKQLFGMQGNLIYYETSEGIVAWNIKSGNRTLVFHYQDNGIPRTYQTMLVLRNGQLPVLRLYKNSAEGDEDWLAPLSGEPVQREDSSICVVDLVDNGLGSRQVSECTGLASRKDMNQSFLYQKADGDGEAFRTQIMAELMAGKGPDMLYVSRSDMALLQELGLLADLKDLVPRETLEDLWPGAVSMGTLDGKLAGLPVNITMASGLAVSGDTWEEETWQLEDVIALMEEGRLENVMYYASSEGYFAPLATALWLLEYSLEDSFLIDWEKRESHFEDERLIRLLEITKNGGDVPSDDMGNWSHGGKSFAFFNITTSESVNDFAALAGREGINYVGFPTEGNGGNYLETGGMLVVNVNAKNRKGIETYLEYYLGDEIQGLCDKPIPGMITDSAFSVRRFHVEEIEQSPEGEYLWRGKTLTVMEDGSTSLHKLIPFLECCVPAPSTHPDLMKIISEELTAYYEGDKSAEQTAEITDRRIQIYLDEGS